MADLGLGIEESNTKILRPSSCLAFCKVLLTLPFLLCFLGRQRCGRGGIWGLLALVHVCVCHLPSRIHDLDVRPEPRIDSQSSAAQPQQPQPGRLLLVSTLAGRYDLHWYLQCLLYGWMRESGLGFEGTSLYVFNAWAFSTCMFFISTYIHYTCMCIYVCICVYIYVYLCLSVCVCLCACDCGCLRVCIYIY